MCLGSRGVHFLVNIEIIGVLQENTVSLPQHFMYNSIILKLTTTLGVNFFHNLFVFFCSELSGKFH